MPDGEVITAVVQDRTSIYTFDGQLTTSISRGYTTTYTITGSGGAHSPSAASPISSGQESVSSGQEAIMAAIQDSTSTFTLDGQLTTSISGGHTTIYTITGIRGRNSPSAAPSISSVQESLPPGQQVITAVIADSTSIYTTNWQMTTSISRGYTMTYTRTVSQLPQSFIGTGTHAGEEIVTATVEDSTSMYTFNGQLTTSKSWLHHYIHPYCRSSDGHD